MKILSIIFNTGGIETTTNRKRDKGTKKEKIDHLPMIRKIQDREAAIMAAGKLLVFLQVMGDGMRIPMTEMIGYFFTGHSVSVSAYKPGFKAPGETRYDINDANKIIRLTIITDEKPKEK